MRVDRKYRRYQWLSAMVLAAMAPFRSSPAQTPDAAQAFSLVGGLMQYDLSGTGNAFFAAARVELPLSSIVLLEPGLTFSQYDADFGSEVSLLFGDVQLQLQGRGGLSPYIGVGVGPAFAFTRGESATELSVSGALGLRVRLDPRWRIGGELRIRAIDPFAGTTAEWGLGVSRRF
jgi:hypothetical protein